MDLLHLQHLSECIEYVNHVITCIDNAYTLHAANLAVIKSQSKSEASSASSSRYSSKAVIVTNFDYEVKKEEVSSSPSPGVVDLPSLPLGLIRQAVLTSDSNKTRSEVNRLLSYCCKLTIEEMLLMEARRTPFPVDEIKKRIRMKIIKKSAPISN